MLVVFNTRYEYLESRSFRALNEFGTLIDQRLESFRGVLKFLKATNTELEAISDRLNGPAMSESPSQDSISPPQTSEGSVELRRKLEAASIEVRTKQEALERQRSEFEEAKSKSQRAESTLSSARKAEADDQLRLVDAQQREGEADERLTEARDARALIISRRSGTGIATLREQERNARIQLALDNLDPQASQQKRSRAESTLESALRAVARAEAMYEEQSKAEVEAEAKLEAADEALDQAKSETEAVKEALGLSRVRRTQAEKDADDALAWLTGGESLLDQAEKSVREAEAERSRLRKMREDARHALVRVRARNVLRDALSEGQAHLDNLAASYPGARFEAKLRSVADLCNERGLGPELRFSLDERTVRSMLRVSSCKKAERLCGSDDPRDAWRRALAEGHPSSWCQTGLVRLDDYPIVEVQIPFASLASAQPALRSFEQALIVSSSGQVVYSRGGDFARVARIGKDLLRGRAVSSETSKDNSGKTLKEPPWERSRVIPVEMGGAEYLLFAQPYSPPGWWANETRPIWYLVGLVPEAELRSSAFSLPLTLLGTVLILLLVGALAGPYLKIRLIGARERLRPVDAYLLGLSLVMGTGLITVLLLSSHVHVQLRSRLDGTASKIATLMLEKFDEELVAALQTLTRESAEFVSFNEEAAASPEEWHGSHEYPPYEALYWLDGGGVQVGSQKTYRSAFGERIEVPDRTYFLRARDGPLWTHPKMPSGSACRFFASRIRTYDHGWRLTILSTPLYASSTTSVSESSECVGLASGPTGGSERVAVLAKRFLTFMAPALPPGFGFAVVDTTGTTIYHSDDHRSLIENFFLETDSDRRVQTAVRLQRGDHTDARYNGRPHGMWIQPVLPLPWSLVVFYDKELLHALFLQLIVSTSFQLVLYSLWLGFWVVGISILGPPGAWAWIWPRTERRSHAGPTATTAALGAYFAWALSQASGWGTAVVAFALPLTVAAVVATPGSRSAPSRAKLWQGVGALGWTLAVSGIGSSGSAGLAALGAVGALLWALPWIVEALPSEFGRHRLGWLHARLPSLMHREAGFSSLGRPAPGYVPFALCLVVVISVLPTAAFFGDASRVEAARATRLVERETVLALERRTIELQRDAARLRPQDYAGTFAPKVTRRSEDEQLGLYLDFCPRRRPTAGGVADEPERDCISVGLLDPSVPDADVAAGTQPTVHRSGAGTEMSAGDPHDRVRARSLASFMALAIPPFSRRSAELRLALMDESTAARPSEWQARRSPRELSVTSRPQASRADHVRPGVLALYSSGGPGWPIAVLGEILLAGLLLVGLAGLLGSIARRVLGSDLWLREVSLPAVSDTSQTRKVEDHPLPGPSEGLLRRSSQGQLLLLLIRPGRKRIDTIVEKERSRLGSARVVVVEGPDQPAVGAGLAELVIVRALDLWMDLPGPRRRLLEMLESIVASESPRRSAILCCEVSPLYRILRPQAYEAGASEREPASDASRWTALLSTFRKERLPAVIDPGDSAESASSALQRECGWSPELLPISQALSSLPTDERKKLTPEDVVAQVGDRADAFYWRLWRGSTRDEQLVLIDLAEGNLVNPENREVLVHLLRRGLIQRRPHFTVVSESFRRFVQTAQNPDEVREWRRQVADSAWSIVQIPLVLALLTGGGLLLYASREAIDLTIGAIPAILGALPLLVRAMSGLRAAAGGHGVLPKLD